MVEFEANVSTMTEPVAGTDTPVVKANGEMGSGMGRAGMELEATPTKNDTVTEETTEDKQAFSSWGGVPFEPRTWLLKGDAPKKGK